MSKRTAAVVEVKFSGARGPKGSEPGYSVLVDGKLVAHVEVPRVVGGFAGAKSEHRAQLARRAFVNACATAKAAAASLGAALKPCNRDARDEVFS